MNKFKQFLEENGEIITETIHNELQDIIDSDTIPIHYKLNMVSKKVRELGKQGIDSGLHEGKPKKGSSRAVFFPKEPKKIILDGKETHVPSALKIAFHSTIDHYRDHGDQLLGEMQNSIEGDWYPRQHHSILKENDDGSYSTNHDGILMPVFHSHPEDHYLEVGKVEPFKEKDFKEYTKTEDFPKGISHQQFYEALHHNYLQAHGKKSHYEIDDKIYDHPYVFEATDLVGNMGLHPGDFDKRNMGLWVHPHTGVKHPVIKDYGYSTDIMQEYDKRRRKHANKNAMPKKW